MDQKTDENPSFRENLSRDNRITSENSGESIDAVVLDSVAVMNSVETSSCIRDDKGHLGSQVDEQGSSDAVVEAPEEVVNQQMCDRMVVGESSSNSVDGVMLEAVIDLNSEQSTNFNGGNRGGGSKNDEMGSSAALVEAPAASIRQGNCERTGQFDRSSNGNSSGSVDMVVIEAVIVVNLDQTACVNGENREVEVKSNEFSMSKPLMEKREMSKVEKEYRVIDMSSGAADGKAFKESWDEERVCRICHLSSEQVSETTSDSSVCTRTVELIPLGCGCKDELGIAHRHCAEAWFKLKGNRSCEICSQTAKNVTGIGDNRFMVEWNEQTIMGSGSNPSERHGGCWRGQPFCNFLMACLVIAFVLPWFFRVNMF